MKRRSAAEVLAAKKERNQQPKSSKSVKPKKQPLSTKRIVADSIPRPNYVPIKFRYIYGSEVATDCIHHQFDHSSHSAKKKNFIFSLCTCKEIFGGVKFRHLTVNDIGIKCCDGCPFFEDDIEKKKVIWVHKSNAVLSGTRGEDDDFPNFWNGYPEKPLGHQVLCAFYRKKWRPMIAFTARVFKLPRKMYDKELIEKSRKRR